MDSPEAEKRIALHGGTAILTALNGEIDVTWECAGGGPRKSVPASLRRSDPAGVDRAKRLVKEIRTDLTTWKAKIEASYLENLNWIYDVWRTRYADHGTLSLLARRLVWRADHEGKAIAFLPTRDGCVDAAGRPIQVKGSAIVRLWHPIDATSEEIATWRACLMARGIVQPFRQVWREVYRVTEAERQTGIYSNRFAGHIIKQHQMMSLAVANGWHCQHRTGFDSADDEPTYIPIPSYGLQAEYWTSALKEGDFLTAGGSYLFLKTDRLKFHTMDGKARYRRGRDTQLSQVPELVFSEIMRHCDLFTSVASIGLDPEWVDRGSDAKHPTFYEDAVRGYWRASQEAPLAPTAQQRRDMLKVVLPHLKHAERLSLTENHLRVVGTRNTYLIHLGSAGVIIEGHRRHVCIVGASASAPTRMTLPFDVDMTMSLILSKCVMLLADDEITDPVIVTQLH